MSPSACASPSRARLDVDRHGGSPDDVALDLAKVARRGTTVPVAATQISKLVDVPLAGTVTAGANLVVEVSTPDLLGTGQQINVGMTAAGESQPGYLRSPLCGPASPMTTMAAGIPDAHLVITVTGTR
jgi:hypothetical protein